MKDKNNGQDATSQRGTYTSRRKQIHSAGSIYCLKDYSYHHSHLSEFSHFVDDAYQPGGLDGEEMIYGRM
jgi:hypothetical protein